MRPAILIIVLVSTFLPARFAAADAFVRLAVEASGSVTHDASRGVGADTPFAIASVGKTLTAVAVLRLVERGTLSLDDPVADLVPRSLAALRPDLAEVRLRHLLTMTSGLPDYYTDDWLDDALADPDRVQTVVGALRAMADDRALFPPGRRFDYSNTNYVLLGSVLEHATGRHYAAVVRSEVFGPAGMTDSFVFGSRPLPARFAQGHADRTVVRRLYSGDGLGDGGVIASARDVGRLYRALFVEQRLLSGATLSILLRDETGEGYGMGIEIEDGIAGHSGGDLGYASDVRIDLRRGVIAVELVAAEDADTDWPWDHVNRR